MSVWLSGDIYGDLSRFSKDSFYEQKDFSGSKDENFIIILGDFGLVWNKDIENGNEKFWLDWLERKPFTTLFVDGNHSNHKRLSEYPIKEWHGGKVHEIRSHVLHLMRGEIFEIEGKKFFAFGGASSHDIQDGILDIEDKDWKKKAKALDKQGKYMYRIKGVSWWPEELPNEEEMRNGISNLQKENNKVDYIITHSPSTLELYLMGGGMYKPDILTNYLEEIKNTVEYKAHYYGHMHCNRAVTSKDICLYEQIIRII